MILKILLGIIVLIVVVFVIRFLFSSSEDDKMRLQKMRDLRDQKGNKAQARILSVGESWRSNKFSTTSYYQFDLEVHLPDGKTFETSKNKIDPSGRFQISDNNVHLIQKDATLPIVYHPEDPEFFVIEFEWDIELRLVILEKK